MRLAFRILDLTARLLMALGVGCLLLGAYLAWQTLSFARDAVRTTGEVVSYHETRDGDELRYRPRVRLRTADRRNRDHQRPYRRPAEKTLSRSVRRCR